MGIMLSGESQAPKVTLLMTHLRKSYKGSEQGSRLGSQNLN